MLCFLDYMNTALLIACAQLPISHLCCLVGPGNLCAPNLLCWFTDGAPSMQRPLALKGKWKEKPPWPWPGSRSLSYGLWAPFSSLGWAGKSPQREGKVERGGSRDLGCRGAPVTAEMSVEFEQRLLRAATRGWGTSPPPGQHHKCWEIVQQTQIKFKCLKQST